MGTLGEHIENKDSSSNNSVLDDWKLSKDGQIFTVWLNSYYGLFAENSLVHEEGYHIRLVEFSSAHPRRQNFNDDNNYEVLEHVEVQNKEDLYSAVQDVLENFSKH